MDTRHRHRAPAHRAALVSLVGGLLALGLAAGPAGATEPGPAYPPGAGATDVVTGGGGDGETGAASRDRGESPAGTGADGGAEGSSTAEGSGPDAGPDAPAPGEDGPGTTDAGTDEDADPGATDGTTDTGTEDDGGDETAAPGMASSDGAPDDAGGRGPGPILIVIATAVLLGGGVIAIARRI